MNMNLKNQLRLMNKQKNQHLKKEDENVELMYKINNFDSLIGMT